MKKSISIILLTALLLQMFCVYTIAAASVDAHDFDVLAKKLTTLGVISSVTHEADDLITRAEFASAAVQLFNWDADGGEQVFYDVDETNPAFGAVYALYQIGAVSLPEDRNFSPNANITYAEAAKILVSMLGYSAQAEAMGDFPAGYLTLANNLNIGLNSHRGGIAYYDMLVAFENMTKIKIPVMHSVIEGSAAYETYAGRTLLSEYHRIYFDTGIVGAVGASNLYSRDTLSEDQAIIGDTIYYFEYDDMQELIGCEADYYYTEEDDRKTVVYAELADASAILDLPAADIAGYKDGIYTYYLENGRTAAAKIEPVPFVMYNGRTATGERQDLYTPAAGSVRLVDSDSNGFYDVIIIKDYKTYIVEAVDVQNSIIYGKYGSEHTLCFDASKGIDAKITTAAGTEVFVGVIGEWSVISALVSEDGKYVRAIVSFETVTGVIENTAEDSGKTTVEIGGVAYEVARNMEQSNITVPKPGTEAVCYLDYEGRIAAIASKEDAGYGYYVMLRYLQDPGLSADTKILVMNSDNEIEAYTLAESTRIDSIKYKTAREQYAALDRGINCGYIVRMRLADDVIYDIDTPYVSDREYEASSLSLYMSKTENLRYKSSGNLEDKFYISDNTFIVFEYPGETEWEDRFLIAPRSMLANDVVYAAVTAFAVGDTFTPQAVLFEANRATGTVEDRTIYVVTEKAKVLDAQDAETNMLSLESGSVSKTLYVDDECAAALGGINVGDVIRVDLYKDNYVLGNSIRKIYDYESDTVTDNSLATANTNSAIAIRVGYVYDKIDSYMSYAAVSDTSSIEAAEKLVTSIPGGMLKITKEQGRVAVQSASAADLKYYKAVGDDCSKILIKYQYRIPYELIIIEH